MTWVEALAIALLCGIKGDLDRGRFGRLFYNIAAFFWIAAAIGGIFA